MKVLKNKVLLNYTVRMFFAQSDSGVTIVMFPDQVKKFLEITETRETEVSNEDDLAIVILKQEKLQLLYKKICVGFKKSVFTYMKYLSTFPFVKVLFEFFYF